MNRRDTRNQAKGYQMAMDDIAHCIEEGGLEKIIQWIEDNRKRKERD